MRFWFGPQVALLALLNECDLLDGHLGQVDQRDIKVGKPFEQSQRVIANTAAYVGTCRAWGVVAAAAWAAKDITSGASTVATCPVSRFVSLDRPYFVTADS